MGAQNGRKQAVGLGLAAGVLLVAAWLADAPAGPAVALAGVAMGWMIARAVAAAAGLEVPAVAEQPSVRPDPAVEGAAITALRHDLRGILSPALLIADRLSMHADPAVQKAGDVVSRTVERAAARLAETKLAEAKKAVADAPPPA